MVEQFRDGLAGSGDTVLHPCLAETACVADASDLVSARRFLVSERRPHAGADAVSFTEAGPGPRGLPPRDAAE